jgi:hypothetical protein
MTLLAAAAFAALAWRQLAFVNRWAVNVLFFDQWGFYTPLFRGQGWWDTFDRRHGPHREGVGLVVTRVVANLGAWNSRWDAFAVSATIIAAALAALLLLKKCGSRAGVAAAVAVPVLFFNAHQYEAFVGAANLSHGAMPVLLLMAFCLACFVRGAGGRLALQALLAFLLIFTGFGIFMGVIAPVVFAVEAFQAMRSGSRRHAAFAALAVASVVASWILFAHGYVFDPAAPNFHFPYERPLQYFVFVGRMLANFYGWQSMGPAPVAFGLAVFAVLAALCARSARRCLGSGIATEPRATVVLILTSYEVIYCASTAVGRVMLPETAPLASRYATLLIPGGLAIVLELAALARGRAAFWGCLAFAVVAATGGLSLRARENAEVTWLHDVHVKWKAAYLATHDKAEADRRADFATYPEPLDFELRFLEEHHLNLFNGSGDP